MTEKPPKSGKLDQVRVTAMLGFGMAVFGSATPVSKLVGAAMPTFVGGLLRVAMGALLLGVLAWGGRRDIAKLSRADWWAVVGIAAFGMFGFSAFMLYGMRSAPGAAARPS
jgi:drug/metabolite transporter (DMT)-like permease